MKALLALAAALLAALVTLSAAHADQFPRFTAERFEGWVEDTGTRNGRIALLPIIVEPGAGYYWQDPQQIGGFTTVNPYAAADPQGFAFAQDGRIMVSYRILTDTRFTPGNLRDQIGQQTNIAASRLAAYTVSFVPPSAITSVELQISGRSVGREDFPSGLIITGGVKEGTFYLENTKATLDALRQGDYRLWLNMTTPMTQFSSLQLDLSAQAVTRSWITAFREVTKKKRRSGFNAGFVDFSRAVQKVRVEEHIDSGSTTAIDTRTDAILRDPTPEQEARFERLLGFAQQTQTEALQQHRAAHAAALAGGSLNLADAHQKYIEVLEDKAPGDSDQILAALAKLSDAEAMQFMTSGIRMSLGSTGTSYKYNGTLVANSTTTVKTEYNEFILRTASVLNRTGNYRASGASGLGLAIDAAYKRLHQRIFGTPTLTSGSLAMTPAQWAQGVAGVIDRGNLIEARYALVEMGDRGEYGMAIDPNYPLDANGNRLLHRAVTGGERQIAELLLRNGADPTQTNRLGDAPGDLASDRGEDAMRQLLATYSGQAGDAVFRVTHPPGLQLNNAQLLRPTAAGKVTVRAVDNTTSEIALHGYPMRGWVSLGVVYTVATGQLPPGGLPFARQVARTPTGFTLVGQTIIAQPIRIRNGVQQSYNVSLVYQGADVGFATPDAFQPLPGSPLP